MQADSQWSQGIKSQTHEDVEAYYGHILKGKNDLKTTACCVAGSPDQSIREALRRVPAEVQEKFYGCGTPFPQHLEGLTVLDLGSGTGRDCYVLGQLVGQSGRVLGIDMTPNQLAVAERHRSPFFASLGWSSPNIDFRQGYIENLRAADVCDGFADLIVSNCVFNLSPRKDLVFAEAWRTLKPGGELYFSDVFVDRRLDAKLAADPVLVGECLGGALYHGDFRRVMQQAGFFDFRIVSRNPIEVTNAPLKMQLGNAQFESVTIRAFKLDLEDACEDYGQAARYLGNDLSNASEFVLDGGHVFEAGRVVPVCRNTARILAQSRFSGFFELFGTEEVHFGLFGRGTLGAQSVGYQSSSSTVSGSSSSATAAATPAPAGCC